MASRISGRGERGGGGDDEPPAIDQIIMGLLKRLPKSGDVWPEAERDCVLQLTKPMICSQRKPR
jgi:hypothetical protein